MKCPFLRDVNVKYCEVSAYRKMILTASTDAGTERCSSHAYAECPAAAPRLHDIPRTERCPFLHLSQAEFCAAASVTKYVPATNDLLSRCNSDGHLYCELFLAHADPEGARRPRPAGAHQTPAGDRTPSIDGIPIPTNLAYAPNHMWLDVADDGFCHVGIDGFAAKVIGAADKVTFVSSRAVGRPIAVLTVNGVDLQMVFPNPLHLSASNVYLRTAPAKMTSDPYGAGWLFEGFEPAGASASVGETVREGLISGEHALVWMRAESERLTQFVHERVAAPSPDGSRFMADGGSVIDGLAAHLDREGLINLATEFFSPQLTWRRSW
jgi:glycine cleavage system H lipoate-binding protein